MVIESAAAEDIHSRTFRHRDVGDYETWMVRRQSVVDRGGEDAELVVEEVDDDYGEASQCRKLTYGAHLHIFSS